MKQGLDGMNCIRNKKTIPKSEMLLSWNLDVMILLQLLYILILKMIYELNSI